MRLTSIAAAIAAFLFILITLLPTQAAKEQQRRYHFRALPPQWDSYARSNSKEHTRSANDAAETPPQSSADTGRGLMAKWMMLKSMLQPTQPPTNNVIVVTAPGSSPTAPTTTTTTITSPTIFTTPTASTITTPTTTTATNSTRNGHLTQVVYGRGENNDYGVGIVKQKGQSEYTKPGMPNQIPMMGQFPRPRRRIHRGQLKRNKQRRRSQPKRKASRPNRNTQVKRRRIPLQAAIANRPLQHKTQRRKVVRPSNQNHIANRNYNFVANTPDAKVDVVNNAGDSAANYLDTNSRLQNVMMNGFRHSQTPIVYNH